MSHKNVSQYNPFVSIALTTYNGKEFLRKQLDSLLSQTYRNLEIVISDDGSDNETIAILNEYVARDKRVRWSRSPLPRGFIKNTENAISLCKGEIIFLCDQDDIWYENRVSLHVAAYKDPRVFWVYNKLVLVDEHDKKIGFLEDTINDYYKKERMKLLYYTWGSCIGGAMTSYRASILHKAMPIGRYCPAHDSWIQLAIFPLKPFFIDEVLQVYRQHNSNEVGWGKKQTMKELKRKKQEAISDNMRYLKYLPENKNLQLWKRIFFNIVYVAKRIRGMFTTLRT
ncbi:MAG: glycosyltransferase [bacterium]